MNGLTIARSRIAHEAEEGTGVLDLGRLDLTELPDELFQLKRLRRLNLGKEYFDDDGNRQQSASHFGRNSLDAQLGRIGELVDLQHLSLNDTRLSDLAPLQTLSDLRSLEFLGTQVSDLTPLQNLSHLQSLNCASTRASDLGPLMHLFSLQFLSFSAARVSNLAPLQGLFNLQSLDCSETQVSNLAPLQCLSNLRWLDCWSTLVSDLVPLQSLYNLRSLYCSWTRVSSLAPLQGLSRLHSLDCSQTPVSDLAPLQGLPNLRSLNCSETRVSDLTPLRNLADLQSLNCWGTQVSDLAPLGSLPNLRWLHCSETPVSDLGPLQGLPNLQSLTCSQCRLASVSDAFWFKRSLEKLVLYRTHIPGIPPEVVSQERSENCLDSLRAHLRDLDAGREAMFDVKLMVLGNGRIGKTQICRRLRGESYDESVESTHGILVASAPLPGSVDNREHLQIWDFGGQDIYHGTHALFMRTRAIFLLTWIPEAENADECEHGGIVFRNRPVEYWLDYVWNFGGTECPVLLIQTRCDQAEDEIVPTPAPIAAFAAFPFKKVLQYSSRLDRGRGALDEALHQAAAWLRDKQGSAEIGAGRSRVMHRLEAMRDADAARPAAERQFRTIAYDDFLQLCREAGGVSAPSYLLTYLHHTGSVFYRDGLFGNQIILDQGWALESIYAVLHREKCFKRLQRQQGRFTRSDLADWLWEAAGHGVAEQELFLSMMQSCGICFAHRPARPEKDIETEYIAPDFLPEKAEIALDLALKWDPDIPSESAEFHYCFLHPGLMRAIISMIGSKAGLNADYWRGGVFVYETGTGSRAMIEGELIEGWQGRIRISTQRGQATMLLQRLTILIEDEQRRMGIAPTAATVARIGAATRGRGPFVAQHREVTQPLKFTAEPVAQRLTFAQEPVRQREYCVSYAWGDDTPRGRERDAVVDRLCTTAAEHGISIVRDKSNLGLGERISKFMKRLGQGNRVFVFLTDKYLRSPFCMFELFEIWRNCREDDEEFLRHVRIYTLPGTEIWTLHDQTQYAVYWRNEYERLNALVRGDDEDEILGQKGGRRYRLMKKISRDIVEILMTVTDVLQPRNFEEFEKYGFHESPGTRRTGEV